MTSTPTSDSSVAPAAPQFSVVRGEPTAEELAALVVVLAAAGAGEESAAKPEHLWNSTRAAMRMPVAHGRGQWRFSSRLG